MSLYIAYIIELIFRIVIFPLWLIPVTLICIWYPKLLLESIVEYWQFEIDLIKGK